MNEWKNLFTILVKDMLHPWKEIMMRLEALGITQKDFSQKIGKRVSEINELIKGKRNITIAWEVILSEFFKTDPKYWIYKQVDYDYEQLQNEIELKQSFLTGNTTLSREEHNGEREENNYKKENIREKQEVWQNTIKNKASWWNTNWEVRLKNNEESLEQSIDSTRQSQEQKIQKEEIFKQF